MTPTLIAICSFLQNDTQLESARLAFVGLLAEVTPHVRERSELKFALRSQGAGNAPLATVELESYDESIRIELPLDRQQRRTLRLPPVNKDLLDIFWSSSQIAIPSMIAVTGTRRYFVAWEFADKSHLGLSTGFNDAGAFTGWKALCGRQYNLANPPPGFIEHLTRRNFFPCPISATFPLARENK